MGIGNGKKKKGDTLKSEDPVFFTLQGLFLFFFFFFAALHTLYSLTLHNTLISNSNN